MPLTAGTTTPVIPLPLSNPVTVVLSESTGVVPPLDVPEKPLVVATDTDAIPPPPPPVADKTPPEKVMPLPMTTLLNPPEPFP